MRFVAATIPTILTLDQSRREALKRREAATSPDNRTAMSSPMRHAVNPLDIEPLRRVHDSAAGALGIAVRLVVDHGRPLRQEPPTNPSVLLLEILKVLTIVSVSLDLVSRSSFWGKERMEDFDSIRFEEQQRKNPNPR